MTPMMEQYLQVKNQYKDYLLFYRIGDFYEMFYEDAKIGSRELDLVLTGRDCGEEERAPMCGIPYHACDVYIGKLIEKGYKVAICEQLEDPALAEGLVKRDVIRVVTPGTLIESDLIPEQKNNYLCAVYLGEFAIGVCFADISTAQVSATSFDGEGMEEALINEIGIYNPSEIVMNLGGDRCRFLTEFVTSRTHASVSENQGGRFEYAHAKELTEAQFSSNLNETAREDHALICAVGGLLDYLREMQKDNVGDLREITVYGAGQFLEMDVNTRRNLELTETMRTKEKKGTLLWVLDKTRTSPGARLLRKWVEHPLLNVAAITRRQGAVEELAGNFMLREELGDLLSNVLDLERLMTKIVYGTANGKDLRAVAATVKILPDLQRLLAPCSSSELSRIRDTLDPLEDVGDAIEKAINPDPPFSIREGGIIATGYNEEVDKLRSVMTDGKSWIERIAEEEKQTTGIKTLKIGYNKVFGYYIEVSKSFVGQVPDRYVRKQTLTNGERYITKELKDMEATILGAADKVCALEFELFNQVRGFVADAGDRIRRAAELLAETDVYVSLATVAVKNKYVRPDISLDDTVVIKDGRHPVVEQFVKDSYFVPNDVTLDTRENRLMLITGPNMAGKSTYMRQVALITVMAQIGSFVPAASAQIGLVDKVFTRVGASDDLASGQSTFMLEMTEVAYILRNATRRSLIIYDEVGRGTSTYDGMSIARAIAEYTASRKIGAKTMFATHYHELTVLEGECPGVVNYNIAAKKRGDNITFLRKIVRGSTDDSYGIEVAKLAGIPNEVIRRAREVLSGVEDTAKAVRTAVGGKEGNGALVPVKDDDDMLISMEDCVGEQIVDQLKNLDLNTLTPYESMQLLFEMQKRLK